MRSCLLGGATPLPRGQLGSGVEGILFSLYKNADVPSVLKPLSGISVVLKFHEGRLRKTPEWLLGG